MFDKKSNNKDRGQVGIGTLIVFIALVLVAAIAAGVLINTAGFLQSQAEATGEESTSQVSSGVDIVSAFGTDTTDSGTIDTATLTASKQAGSEPIDLTSVEIQVVGPSGTGLIQLGTGQLTNVAGADNDLLEEQSDRVEIEIDLATNGAGALGDGQSADLTITTADGAQTFKTLQASNPVQDPEDF